MKIAFAEPSMPKTGAAVVGVFEGRKLSPSAERLDKETGGAIGRAIEASRFQGKKDEVLALLAPPNLPLSRIVLAGLGKAEGVDARRVQDIGGTLVSHLNGAGEKEAAVLLDDLDGLEPGEAAVNLGYGALLRSYRFDKYKTKEKPEKKPSLARFTVMSQGAAAAKRLWPKLEATAEAIKFTRDLVSEPANVIYPETLAEQARTLEGYGVKVEILDERKMKRLGMNALLGVGQGSAHPPRLVVMEWKGSERGKPIAFVGKGVTFDTGGISIKPSEGMWDMKWDMAGAGVVIGLMRALAARKAKVHAVGVVGLVENMPSGAAQRPGDIVTSMSGQTIEVLNTDAEGRLVLADALWYCQDRFKPRFMIDLATLTGAIIVALGHEHAGLFANNDELADRIVAAGRSVGELCWRLPLSEAYDREIDSDAADVKNISGGRAASSITAAQFLQRFVNDVPWAHIDIAGTAWSKKDSPTVPKGATAFGVRLLDRLVAEHYEG
ncbi:MAG: leucyl aminopeptidase [Rhodospirillales bacterium]|nr:leucyl aminopeptidase [Rhodospirillales bacterium]